MKKLIIMICGSICFTSLVSGLASAKGPLLSPRAEKQVDHRNAAAGHRQLQKAQPKGSEARAAHKEARQKHLQAADAQAAADGSKNPLKGVGADMKSKEAYKATATAHETTKAQRNQISDPTLNSSPYGNSPQEIHERRGLLNRQVSDPTIPLTPSIQAGPGAKDPNPNSAINPTAGKH